MEITSLSWWISQLVQAGFFTAFAAFIVWLARNLIRPWFTRKIQHNFDGQLEEIRASNRRLELQLKSQADEHQKDIEAISSGALSALNTRKVAMDQKRLEASQILWETVVDLDKFRRNSLFLQQVNIEAVASSPNKDKVIQDIFNTDESNPEKLQELKSRVSKLRPYLKPSAWYAFETYMRIFEYAELEVLSAQIGSSSGRYMPPQALLERLAKIFPDVSEDIKKSEKNIFGLMNVLKEQLLFEAISMREDTSTSQEQIKQAKELRRLAKDFEDLGNNSPQKFSTDETQ